MDINTFYILQKTRELNSYKEEVRRYKNQIRTLTIKLEDMREKGMNTLIIERNIEELNRKITWADIHIRSLRSQGIV